MELGEQETNFGGTHKPSTARREGARPYYPGLNQAAYLYVEGVCRGVGGSGSPPRTRGLAAVLGGTTVSSRGHHSRTMSLW